MMTFPSVRDYPISNERRKRIIDEIMSTMQEQTIARVVFRTVHREPSNEERFVSRDFLKIGINHIVDKIWFVDYSPNSYSCSGIGYDYANIIAQGELEFIVEQILTTQGETPETVSLYQSLNENDIRPIIEGWVGEHRNVRILTNARNIGQFWWFNQFEGNYNKSTTIDPSGYFLGVPVYWSGAIPNGKTLILDRERIGQLLIKQDIFAEISEIAPSETDGLLDRFPEFTPEILQEKIRVLVYEVVKFEVIDLDALIVLNVQQES